MVGHVLSRWSMAEENLVLKGIDQVLTELISFLETSKFENTSFFVSD